MAFQLTTMLTLHFFCASSFENDQSCRAASCRVVVSLQSREENSIPSFSSYGGFLKWWYPTIMGFPAKNDHFGVFWGYPYFWKPPYRKMLNLESNFHLGEGAHISPTDRPRINNGRFLNLLFTTAFCGKIREDDSANQNL